MLNKLKKNKRFWKKKCSENQQFEIVCLQDNSKTIMSGTAILRCHFVDRTGMYTAVEFHSNAITTTIQNKLSNIEKTLTIKKKYKFFIIKIPIIKSPYLPAASPQISPPISTNFLTNKLIC